METDRPSEKGFQTACLRIGTDRLISTILNCIKPTMVKTKRNAEALLFENDALQNYLLAADAAASAADAAASAEDAASSAADSPAADAASVAADAASVTAVDAALVAEAAASAALSPQAVKNKDIRAAAKRDFFILNT